MVNFKISILNISVLPMWKTMHMHDIKNIIFVLKVDIHIYKVIYTSSKEYNCEKYKVKHLIEYVVLSS